MNKLLNHIILVVLCLYGITCFGQLDPLYNHYLFNQSMINPSYTGLNNVFSANAISRIQWAGMDGAPLTNTLSLSSALFGNRVGAGLLAVSDKVGVNNNTELHMMYSYKIGLSQDVTLSFGIQGGLMSYRHDFSDLNTKQGISDPELSAAEDFDRINFGAGAFLSAPLYYLGISAPRIKNIDMADQINGEVTRYFRHIYLSGGYVFGKGSMLAFKPSFLLKIIDGHRPSYDINAHVFINESLWVGTTLRDFESAGMNAQVNIGDQLRLGYSFGFPVSSTGSTINGITHEFMVSYEFELAGSNYLEKRYW